MKSNRLQKLCIILAFCMIILTVSSVFAQDTTAPESAQTTETVEPVPTGIGLLVLLGGLGAIAIVGGLLWMREQAEAPQ